MSIERTTEGGTGRVSHQTPAPATAIPRSSAAVVKSARRRDVPTHGVSGTEPALNGCRRRLMAQHEQRRRDIPIRCRGILLEASLQQRPNRKGRLRRQGVPIWLGPEHRGERVAHILAAERTFARQHLEQHGTEGPDVRAFVDGFPLRLLRRDVGRRARESRRRPSSSPGS